MNYEDLDLKQPVESISYIEDSAYVISQIKSILDEAKSNEKNKIVIKTNLREGLPLENINKLAGPMVEAWAGELFCSVCADNKYSLINVEAQERLGISDIILQFRKSSDNVVTGNIDVKATADDIKGSGKSPNITSFSRIRTMYVEDPDFMFIILSIKHKVYTERNNSEPLISSIMEIVAYNVYDLKYISENDISYNPALGTGQIQIKDIHYVNTTTRTTWEMCQMLDRKYLRSGKKSIEEFIKEAKKNKWIKEVD